MITVNEDWVITVDAYNYAVCKNKPIPCKDKAGHETGEVSYKADAYFSGLAGALEYIRQENIRKALSDRDMSLVEAVNAIRDADEEMAIVINRAVPDCEVTDGRSDSKKGGFGRDFCKH